MVCVLVCWRMATLEYFFLRFFLFSRAEFIKLQMNQNKKKPTKTQYFVVAMVYCFLVPLKCENCLWR